MFKKIKNNKKGFTLIELIVVIAVIAILAAVLLPRFTGLTKSAKERAVESNIKNYAQGVNSMMAKGEKPNETGVKAFVGDLGGGLTFTGSDGDFTYTGSDGSGKYTYSTGKITNVTVN